MPLATYYGLEGVSLLFLPYVGTLPGLFAWAVVYGLNYISTVPATTALTANIYGRYSVGELSGWIFFSHQLGSAVGSLAGGYLYDRFGNYTVAFHSAALVAFAATLMVLAIRERPALGDRRPWSWSPRPPASDRRGPNGGTGMATETRTILTACADGVATLTLNRPEVRNALDMTMRRDLEAALARLDEDPGVRVVVVRGAGEHFCAGGDVKLMRDNPMTAAEGQSRVEAINRAILALARFRAPTIAMVDGAAAGAGCNLALACDLVVASDRARFGELFARIGLIPDAGGTYFLPRRVGLARAKELVFTADIVDAREAERIGLINRVVPAGELEAETYALARRIADGPPRVLAAAKALLDRAPGLDLESALHWEALTQGAMIAAADHREGLRAFFEKRPPRFTGG